VSKGSESDTYISDAAELDAGELDAGLMAVTPIDGRYHARTRALAAYSASSRLSATASGSKSNGCSRWPRIPRNRGIPLDGNASTRLRTLYADFTLADARRVKELERHDQP